jgi:hypothetical protein
MQSLRITSYVLFAVAAVCGSATVSAQATARWTGRVVNDRTGEPLAAAQVGVPTLSVSTTTDSSGRFALEQLAAGTHQLVVRLIGFAPLTTAISTSGMADDEHELRLVPAPAALSKVDVVTTGVDRRLTLFETHRTSNYGGAFLTTEQLLRERGRPFADVLQSVAGADIVRGRGGAAYFATRRGYDSFMNMPKARPADRARGASSGLCYAAVVVNNVFVYRGDDDEDMFDVNLLPPDDIIAVEVYKGGATMPLEYNSTRKTCGLLVLYTK